MPLDIHSIILYYNKDAAEEGRPARRRRQAQGPRRRRQLGRRARQADDRRRRRPVALHRRRRARCWRIFYTLLSQQDGSFLKDGKFLDGDNLAKATTAIAEMQKWVKSGWTPAKTEYPASIALFTSGKAAMHINGVWEVPTMVDLAKKGKLFDWGAIQIPTFYAHPATWADSHSFAIPNRKGNPVDRRQAQARARRHPLVQRALARLGGRRPHPGLSAGAG